MRLAQREAPQTSVSYLYDPIPLDKVALDVLKEAFGSVDSNPDSEFIYAESVEQKRRAQVLTARLDFLDESGSDLEDGWLTAVRVLLRALPPINVKGLGVTLSLKAVVEGEKDAGMFVTKRFLAQNEELAQTLKSPLLAAQCRFTYGDLPNYFDVRFTPAHLGGEWLNVHLRKHKDSNLTDSDRIIKETRDVYRESVVEFARLLDIV